MRVTLFKHVWDKTGEQVDLDTVLSRIKSDELAIPIRRLNRAPLHAPKEITDLIKKNLPAFTGAIYTGGATSRETFNVEYSTVLILDIDHFVEATDKGLDNPNELEMLRNDFAEGQSILTRSCRALFRSPSGDGVKLVYILDKKIVDPDEYSRIWLVLADMFRTEFMITADKGTKDITRLCFLSHDPYMYENKEAVLSYAEISNMVDNNDDAPTVSIKAYKGQEQMFVAMAEVIACTQYRHFRNLCSSASNINDEVFMEQFYDVLLNWNRKNMTETSSEALRKNKKGYIKSFLKEHNRVPLQYLISQAENFGFVMPKASKNKTKKMFDYQPQIHSILSWMSERHAVFNKGQAIIYVPDITKKRYYSVARNDPTGDVSRSAVKMTKRSDFKEYMANMVFSYYTEDGSKKSIGYYDLWWRSRARRECERLVCAPQSPPASGTINTWTGFNISPDRLKAAIDIDSNEKKIEPLCQPLLDFIFEIICSKEHDTYDMLMNWMADLLQNPTCDKPGVAIILRSSGQGTGKGTFAMMLQDIIGVVHSTKLQDTKHMAGDFNSIIENKLLVILDEAVFVGDKRVTRNLMTLVSEPTVTIRKMYTDAYETDSPTRFIMLTNEEHAIDIPVDNRRFYTIEVAEHKKDDLKYFGKIRSCMVDYGKESLFNNLMNREYEREDLLIRNKMNKATLKQAKQSFSRLEQWIVGLLSRQYILTSESTIRLSSHLPSEVTLESLWYDFEITYNKSRYALSYAEFTLKLKSMNIIKKARRGKDKYNSIRTFYDLLPLNTLAEMYPIYQPDGWTPLDLINFKGE